PFHGTHGRSLHTAVPSLARLLHLTRIGYRDVEDRESWAAAPIPDKEVLISISMLPGGQAWIYRDFYPSRAASLQNRRRSRAATTLSRGNSAYAFRGSSR